MHQCNELTDCEQIVGKTRFRISTLSEKDVSAKLRPRSCVNNGTPAHALTNRLQSDRQLDLIEIVECAQYDQCNVGCKASINQHA